MCTCGIFGSIWRNMAFTGYQGRRVPLDLARKIRSGVCTFLFVFVTTPLFEWPWQGDTLRCKYITHCLDRTTACDLDLFHVILPTAFENKCSADPTEFFEFYPGFNGIIRIVRNSRGVFHFGCLDVKYHFSVKWAQNVAPCAVLFNAPNFVVSLNLNAMDFSP